MSVISVVALKPGGVAVVRQVEQDDLAELQGLVGGYLEAVKFLDRYVLFCNEDGRRLELAPNIAWTGDLVGVIRGPLFVAGPPDQDGDLTDLTEADTARIMLALGERWL